MRDPVGTEIGRMGAVHRAFVEIGTVKHASVQIIDVVVSRGAQLVNNGLMDLIVKRPFLLRPPANSGDRKRGVPLFPVISVKMTCRSAKT